MSGFWESHCVLPNWKGSPQNWTESHHRKCRLRQQPGQEEGQWDPSVASGFLRTDDPYVARECPPGIWRGAPAGEMGSVLISSGEQAGFVCQHCGLSWPEVPRFANEVSRIYKMWECSANLRNLRAMIIQKSLIIHVLCSECHCLVGELRNTASPTFTGLQLTSTNAKYNATWSFPLRTCREHRLHETMISLYFN